MTRLAIGSKTDPLIKAAVRLELVAIIAIELLSIQRRNVGSEMALMIETQHVGIARADAFQLKFGMRFPKRSECRRKTLRRSRQLDRKSTRLNSSHTVISYAVFCLKKKTQHRK